jgi:hypothetical protein
MASYYYCQVVMLMLRNREKRKYQNHTYDAPSYLHLVQVKSLPKSIHDQFFR